MADNDEETMAKLKANPDLEAHVQKMGTANIHPWVQKIQHKFGVFNIPRNARNAKQKALDDLDKAAS